MTNEDFNDLTDFMKKEMGIYMYGLDLVKNQEDGKLYLFDCNYQSTCNGTFANQDLSLYVMDHIQEMLKKRDEMDKLMQCLNNNN